MNLSKFDCVDTSRVPEETKVELTNIQYDELEKYLKTILYQPNPSSGKDCPHGFVDNRDHFRVVYNSGRQGVFSIDQTAPCGQVSESLFYGTISDFGILDKFSESFKNQ